MAVPPGNNVGRQHRHISVEPLTGALGAEISGVDLDEVSDDVLEEIRRACDDHLVVFFRDQDLTLDGFERFAGRWGELGDDPFVAGTDTNPRVVRVLKEPEEALPVVFGGAWHSDWSFMRQPPAYTFLHAVDVPSVGGDTIWSNMYLVTDSLDQDLLSTLKSHRVVHSPDLGYGPAARHNDLIENMDIRYGEEGAMTREHPAVVHHPRTGREVVFVNPVYTVEMAGMAREESASALEIVHRAAQNPVCHCRFRWRPGSLAVWDNRCTIHLAVGDYHGQRREMWHTTVRGEVPEPPPD